MYTRHLRVHFAFLLCALLGGCATVGPTAIGNGRTPYNDAIQSTASQQTLLNIVHVYNNETPQFVDVSEVDEVTTVGGSVSGGGSNIGTTALGAVTGMGSYQEAPTVRYLPLSGQALIAQVSTPITVESLTNLTSSDWDLGAVLTLGVDRITPGYRDYDTAVDALIALDRYGAIIITATQSTESEASGKNKITAVTAPTKDTLTIYLKSKNTAQSPAYCDSNGGKQQSSSAIVGALWNRLKQIYDVPNQKDSVPITIKSRGSPFVTVHGDGAPLLATRSALGVLKAAAEIESPTIAFLPEADVREIIDLHKRQGDCAENFYSLDPKRFDRSTFEKIEDPRTIQDVSDYINSDKTQTRITPYAMQVRMTPKQIGFEQALANTRRFMLVATSPIPPRDAYTSVRRGDTFYSILDGDIISKRTLALVNQFDTIQAVPTATAPLTPSITVGSK